MLRRSAKSTLSPFVQDDGEPVIVQPDVEIATERERCRHQGNGCVRSTSFRFCGSGGGLATVGWDAANALTSHHLKSDSAASTTDQSNRAHGSGAAIQPVVLSASVAVPVLRPPGRAIRHGKDYACGGRNRKSARDSHSAQLEPGETDLDCTYAAQCLFSAFQEA